MPVTSTSTVTHQIIELHIDMVLSETRVILRKFLDGNAVGDVEFTVVDPDFTTMLKEIPTAGQTRREDVSHTLYAYAISKGYIAGTIS